MKHDEIVFLSIAGFILELRFVLSVENFDYERVFIEKVKSYYKNFLREGNYLKANYVVEVVYQHSFRVVINKKSDDTYIHLYRQLAPSRIRTFYHLSGSQLQILIRKISHELLVKSQGFILHGSAIKTGCKATIFLGESGAGKSTTMNLLSSVFYPLGDDSIIIKKEQGSYYCYSSTAQERNEWFLKNFKRTDLGAIYFLRKSVKSEAAKIEDKEVILHLISKQLFSEKKDVTTQVENLLYFIDKFNKFYYLDVSLKNSEDLKRIMLEN